MGKSIRTVKLVYEKKREPSIEYTKHAHIVKDKYTHTHAVSWQMVICCEVDGAVKQACSLLSTYTTLYSACQSDGSSLSRCGWHRLHRDKRKKMELYEKKCRRPLVTVLLLLGFHCRRLRLIAVVFALLNWTFSLRAHQRTDGTDADFRLVNAVMCEAFSLTSTITACDDGNIL